MSRQEQKAETRAAILESASRLLRERGPVAPSVAEVMKGAGLTVGGFYAHFESKEQLMEEALKLSTLSPKANGLDALLRKYLSEAHRDQRDEGCPLPCTVASLLVGEDQPRMREALAASLERTVTGLATDCGGDRERALAVFALMLGGMSLARALGADEPLSQATLRACERLAREAVGS